MINNCYLIWILIIFCVISLLSLIKNKKIDFIKIAKLLISLILFIFIVIYINSKNYCSVLYILFIWSIYFVITIILKEIISLFIFGKYKISKKVFKCIQYSFCYLIISPDYFITKTIKESNEKCVEEVRSKLLKSFNFLNIFLSSLIFVLILFLKTNKYIFIIEDLLLFRILSRTIEIIISFINDIIDNKQNSHLKNDERIMLSFISIFEIFIMLSSKMYLDNNSNFLLIAINKMFSISVSSLTDVLSFIAVFSLFGIVISSYIGRKND